MSLFTRVQRVKCAFRTVFPCFAMLLCFGIWKSMAMPEEAMLAQALPDDGVQQSLEAKQRLQDEIENFHHPTPSRTGEQQKIAVAARTPVVPPMHADPSEPLWQSAPPITGFTQYDPIEGAAATESTVVRVLYDDRALYICAMMYDRNPSGIVHQLTRRDRIPESDRFTVLIDSYHDRQTAFVFSVNVDGVQMDWLLSNDGVIYDMTWDAVWNVKTRVLKDGWCAQLEIPYSALRFSKGSAQEWGINFRRYISRKHELDEWRMIPRKEKGQVSKIGTLVGIKDINPPLRMEFLPYSAMKGISQPSLHTPHDLQLNVGLDVKYGITNDITLDATVNPDFGQVEADRAVLNLTTFETYYPEKRPFFLEGMQIFNFGTTSDGQREYLFYSRRIGRRPYVPDRPGYELIQSPPAARILSAAKISGHTTSGLSLGLLQAVTNEEKAIYEDSLGQRHSFVVAPFASYSIVRVKQDLFRNSAIGFMGTNFARRGLSPSSTGGIDWNFRMFENTIAFDGFLVGSRSLASTGFADGTSGRVLFGKVGGEHWLYWTLFDYASRRFNINDLGFVLRPDLYGGYSQVIYKEDRLSEPSPFLRYILRAAMDYRWNFDGALITHNAEINPYFELRNFWSVFLSYQHDWRYYDDRETRGNGLYYRPSSERFQIWTTTDPRKLVTFKADAVYLTKSTGAVDFSFRLSTSLRPAPWVELHFESGIDETRRDVAWLRNVSDSTSPTGLSSIFGKRNVQTLDFYSDGIIMFTRNLSLQFALQVFMASWKYGDIALLRGRDTFIPIAYSGLTAFNTQTMNMNAVLRWEYLPGSTLYLVWTQSRSNYAVDYLSSLSDNLRSAFRILPDNAIMLKISYWWHL
ncbi:MAG: DUF5916 domain-containing protein [Bacteroidota bacterium]